MKRSIKVIVLLIILLIASTGCTRVSQSEKTRCESIGMQRATTWLRNKGINANIVSANAKITGDRQIWYEVYLDQRLSGDVDVEINYNGVNKAIKTDCKGTDEEAYNRMDTLNGREDQLTSCVTYDGIKVCNVNGEEPDIQISTSYEKLDENQVINTYTITQKENRGFFRVYIPIYKVGSRYNSLTLLNKQIRTNGDYTSKERLNVTNDFNYFYTSINITEGKGQFTIIENR